MTRRVFWAVLEYKQMSVSTPQRLLNIKVATVSAPTKHLLDIAIKKEKHRKDYVVSVKRRGSYSGAMWNWERKK